MGGNLGDRRTTLRAAIAALGAAQGVTAITGVSDVYETEPVGGPPGQQDHLNLVVGLDWSGTPHALLALCAALEADAGRVREERWGPRTLDVDILWIDGVCIDEPDLVLPHPRFHERRFVLAPLAELAPELCPPDWEATAVGAVRRLGPL